MFQRRFAPILVAFLACASSAVADVQLPGIISDHMLLQRDVPVRIFGKALPGEAIDACIAIRTIVLDDGVALLQAGAGIVADSNPAAEHDECLRKLAALETAIELAEARK